MRRNEFEVDDVDAMTQMLHECDYGVLSVLSGGEPYGVAVNFVFEGGVLYFHGSREGRKAEAIGTGAKASFLAVKPYAFIPSYFSGTRSACPATQFFASVHIDGEVAPLTDAAQKASALNALMRKMQPEGGFEPIGPANPLYRTILEKTGVYTIAVAQASLKVKAGQNLSQKQYEALTGRLRERGEAADRATMETMAAFRP